MTRETFTGADVSLYHVAARRYGDPLLWILIAEANDMLDPLITGTVQLVIPPKPSSNNGGIPSL